MGRNRKPSGDFTQNHGKPGVVYALGNKTLPKYLKIGQTRNMAKRLASLNADCNTSNPIRGFFVAYSRETDDCGRAELRAHQALVDCRVDAYREFFECDIETARRAIDEACEAFQNKPPKPPPVVTESPRQLGIQDLQAEAANLKYRAQLTAQHALLMARAEEDELARHEEWRRDREERLRTADRISEINRRAQAKKDAESAVADHRLELNPGTFTVVVPAPAVPTPELEQQPSSFSKILFAVFAAIFVIGSISALTPSEPTQPVQAPPSPPPDPVANEIALYVSRYAYPPPSINDETTLIRVYTENRTLIFQYKSTDRGEKVMAVQFDPDHIRRAMTALACSKDDVRAFLARGVVVIYVLERSNGSKTIQHIACTTPGS